MKIILNGKEVELKKSLSVQELLDKHKLNPEQIVVEINLNIIEKDKYDKTFLVDNDKVELISFMGGG